MKLVVSPKIRQKLTNKTPPVGEHEILECFANRTGKSLIDTRAKNQTNPLTRWFIAETNSGRLLKVCYVPQDGEIYLKTAYDPDDNEKRIYRKYGV